MTSTTPYIWLSTLILDQIWFVIMLLFCLYGLHRYWQVWTYHRHRKTPTPQPQQFDQLPKVTIQIPLYNEPEVAQRIIQAAADIDYPQHLIDIQVLDDSTDHTPTQIKSLYESLTSQGHNITHITRDERTGYKAGALAEGLKSAHGQFIAIFDADFIPLPDFLQKTIHTFTDEKVGMVQTCWGHLNPNQSILTKAQSQYLDGHFHIEHFARNKSGRWINFNGTAGIWRKTAIEQAGGWQGDTLSEDVDLSYRSQLKDWKFVYLPHVICPAEIPSSMLAFKSQQHRWTKGTIQNAFKHIPKILSAKIPAKVKLESFFHLTSPAVSLLMFITMCLLSYSLISQNTFVRFQNNSHTLSLTFFLLGFLSVICFYTVAGCAGQRTFLKSLLTVPSLLALGIGLSINNASAVLEAIFRYKSPFIRTPKAGDSTTQSKVLSNTSDTLFSRRTLIQCIEFAMLALMVYCLIITIQQDQNWLSLPFLALFIMGLAWVSIQSLLERLAK